MASGMEECEGGNDGSNVDKLAVQFDDYGRPVGPNSATYSTKLGQCTRAHAPITCEKWKDVSADRKELIWTRISEDNELRLVPGDELRLRYSGDATQPAWQSVGHVVSGPKFYYLRNEAVMLEMGLTNWAISEVMRKGFTPLITPEIVRSYEKRSSFALLLCKTTCNPLYLFFLYWLY